MQIKLQKRALHKSAVAGMVVAAFVCVVVGGLRLTFPVDAAQNTQLDHIQIAQLVQSPTVSGDCNIIGSGNSITGGINCPKMGPNPPKFEIGQQTIRPRSDGTFDLVVMTSLSSQTLVQLLYVSVEGPDVIDFNFEPGMGGVFNNWYGTMNDDGAKALGYQNPQPGSYILTVHTKTQPSLASKINVRWNVVPN
jgi:hypothetical protein